MRRSWLKLGIPALLAVLIYELDSSTKVNGDIIYMKVKKSNKDEVNPEGIPLLVDAFIDIYPDNNKYTYNAGEYGTVNVHVKTYADPLGAAYYFVKLPQGVNYVNVYDGPQPSYVHYLDAGEYVLMPNYGIIYGPCTVVEWRVIHNWNYEKYIKIKVRYVSSGTFNIFSNVNEEVLALGVKANDNDSFTATVN